MKTSLKTLASVSVASLLINSGQAASISLNNVGATPNASLAIAYAGTSTAASGGIAAAGYFSTFSDSEVATLSADIANIPALIADFVVVGSTTLDSAFAGGAPGAGLFDANFTGVTLPNSTRAGAGLYTFLGNSASLAASDQWLLWDNTAVVDAQDTPASPDSNSLLMAQEGSALISGGSTTVNVDLSGIGGPASFELNAIQFAVVPEPSVALLGVFGVIGLMRRRR